MQTKQTTIFVSGFVLGVLFLAAALAVWQFASSSQNGKVTEISINQAVAKIDYGQIKELIIQPSQFDLTDNKGNRFYAKIEATNETMKTFILQKAVEKGVTVKSEEATRGIFWSIMSGYLPIFFFSAFWLLAFILLLQLVIKNFRGTKIS